MGRTSCFSSPLNTGLSFCRTQFEGFLTHFSRDPHNPLLTLFVVCSDVKHHRFANSTTSGNSRTSSKNLASKGEPLSLRQTRAKGNRKFKSATGINTTPAGHRQRVALLTKATPNPHETRLRIVASFTPS